MHPTARVRRYAGFPQGWRESMLDWFSKCDHPERVEYILSVHASRWADFWSGELGPAWFPAWGRVLVVRNDGRDDNVTQINAAAAASSGKLLAGTMDDLFPPKHWDTVMAAAIGDADAEAVLHCSTGSPRDWEPLINAGAMTRARYLRFGYLAYPEYESMYIDNEITAVSYRDGVVIERRDIDFVHRHWSMGLSPGNDEIYRLQNRVEAYERGRALFERRRAAGFPVDVPRPETVERAPDLAPVLAAPLELLPAGVMPIRKSLALCFPGDSFPQSWNAHAFVMFAEMLRDYAVFMPLWGYCSNVYVVRLAMLDHLLKAENKPDLVLWVDSDNLLTYEQFCTLAADLEEHPDADLVAGWSWCRPNDYKVERKVSAGHFDEAGGRCAPLTFEEMQAAPRDLIEVGYTGFPAVLMRYSTLERAGANAFAPVSSPAFAWGFSPEDVAFSRAAVAAGCRLFVDRRVRVPHLKRAVDDEEGLALVHQKQVVA
jgi:hypothetical protein